MDVTLVSNQNPFEQDMLSQNDCYILDNGANKKVFVWKGTENRNRVSPLFLPQLVCAAFILLNTHLRTHTTTTRGKTDVFPRVVVVCARWGAGSNFSRSHHQSLK